MMRKDWIDAVKGMSMLCVYLLHSEAYYGGSGSLLGRAMHPFYVNAFFFVSGYLFFSSLNRGGDSLAAIRKKIHSVVYRLVIPTILFATLMYLPKMLFHGNDTDFSQYFLYVWGGVSYWFTSALAVAQLILLLLASVNLKGIGGYVVITAALFTLSTSLDVSGTVNDSLAYFPWFWKTALVYSFIMALGGMYHRCEARIEHLMKFGWIVLLVIFLGIVWCGQPVKALGVGGRCNLAGFVAMCCSILLLVMLAKRIRPCKWLEYVGKNSIVFYFFSGVYPAAVGAAVARMVPDGRYGMTMMVATISILLGAATTYAVNRYAPFMLDLRMLYKKSSV